jgi:hypothetical protein
LTRGSIPDSEFVHVMFDFMYGVRSNTPQAQDQRPERLARVAYLKSDSNVEEVQERLARVSYLKIRERRARKALIERHAEDRNAEDCREVDGHQSDNRWNGTRYKQEVEDIISPPAIPESILSKFFFFVKNTSPSAFRSGKKCRVAAKSKKKCRYSLYRASFGCRKKIEGSESRKKRRRWVLLC